MLNRTGLTVILVILGIVIIPGMATAQVDNSSSSEANTDVVLYEGDEYTICKEINPSTQILCESERNGDGTATMYIRSSAPQSITAIALSGPDSGSFDIPSYSVSGTRNGEPSVTKIQVPVGTVGGVDAVAVVAGNKGVWMTWDEGGLIPRPDKRHIALAALAGGLAVVRHVRQWFDKVRNPYENSLVDLRHQLR